MDSTVELWKHLKQMGSHFSLAMCVYINIVQGVPFWDNS